MRKWKKAAALLLAACLAGSLCACGGGGDTPPPVSPAPAPAEDTPQDSYEPVADETPPEPEPEPEPEDPAEPEGLILLSMDPDMPKDERCCMVSSLDPETGELRVLSSFDYRGTMEYYFDFPENRYATGKDRFNDDYTKIALTWGKVAGKERHAGWMNSDGSFFDVTEALGQSPSSEFADPVYYHSLGFDNGNFVFARSESPTGKRTYYSVPESNVTPDAVEEYGIYHYSPYDEDDSYGLYINHDVTDWIDDRTCLIDDFSRVCILNDETGEKTEIVPGSETQSWNGVVSPDGTEVAFIAYPDGSPRNNIYRMPISGGEPTPIPNDLSWTWVDSFYKHKMPKEAGLYVLIDWR